MGWCHEFGPMIEPSCHHPMVAGEDACHCEQCGVVCDGRFEGCKAVWANRPAGPDVWTIGSGLRAIEDRSPGQTDDQAHRRRAAVAPVPDLDVRTLDQRLSAMSEELAALRDELVRMETEVRGLAAQQQLAHVTTSDDSAFRAALLSRIRSHVRSEFVRPETPNGAESE